MHEIFEELEEELTPFGHQSLEVLGLDSKQLITLITDRAEKRVPAPPKSGGH